jgi:hypothetical protein
MQKIAVALVMVGGLACTLVGVAEAVGESSHDQKTNLPEQLEPSDIFQVIVGHREALQKCFGGRPTKATSRPGEIVMHWIVEKDGSVSDAKHLVVGEFKDSPVTKCLAKEISSWKFPPVGGKAMPISFEFPADKINSEDWNCPYPRPRIENEVPNDLPDTIPQGDIMSVIVGHKDAIEKCFVDQRAKNPDTAGRLTMHWIIERSGAVSDVRCATDEFKDSVMARCLAKEISSWTFPCSRVWRTPIDFPFKF